ncbi:N-acetylmuramoyl-L-alanine amidase [Streptomyces sp. URMC 129]|uniref:N-acetylmuramoyl-L-alanine amidase n=1 Tax=Streptomyces sp. URMC 129 TaxID=3423407 RepID=UPI003F1DAFE2
MATPLTADRLVAALRAEGVKVVEHRSWRTNNRNHVGSWGPVNGVMIHHTVTSGTVNSVELCYYGRSDLPGPLCHGVIAKDGTVYLVGHGRANHAGKGDGDVLSAVKAEAPLPADNEADTDGNTHFYGFECVNLGDGKDPWPKEQVEAVVRASAALCRAHDWGRVGPTSVIGHLEWQPGKIDPRGPGITMSDVRARVAERLKHPAGWNPGEDEEMPLTAAEIEKIAERVWEKDGLIEVPWGTEQNPEWAPKFVITDTGNILREVRSRIKAMEAQIAALQVGGVNLEALAEAVADKLASRLAE